MSPADLPVQVCTLIWCQNVGWEVRERVAIYRSVHQVLIHTIFSTPASSCQNVISEIVERMESVQPGEQKTQEKTKRAWALYSVNRKAVMGKGSCLALFPSEQLHWINVVSEWISAPRLRKPVSLLHKPCVYPPSFPPRFIPRIGCWFQERSLPQVHILLPLKFPFKQWRFLFAVKG